MNTEQAFQLACERYQQIGVDARSALDRLAQVSISVHCWQGDDVQGFESHGNPLGGGLAVTGNYPGQGPHTRRIAVGSGARPSR